MLGWSGVKAVIEKPQVYRISKADPNDLIALSVVVGEWKEYLGQQGAEVELVTPKSWKGSVPKKIHNARVLSLLTKKEVALLPKRTRAKDYDHNLLDAVGLGLWRMGRR